MHITPHTTIHEALSAHPELLEVLIAQSPAFEKLRNPLLRRTLTRLTTLEQAAGFGKVDPRRLVQVLNEAIGETPAPAGVEGTVSATVATEAPAWLAAPVAVELDARPILDRGGEPFSQIMAAVPQVPEGQQFVLRARFEPLPLYTVLGKRGFQPYARCLAPDDWEVHFYRRRSSATAATTSTGSQAPTPDIVPVPEIQPVASGTLQASSEDWKTADATLTIDVRELTPPEPMMRILEAVAELEPGQRLLVHHARYPVHLIPRLEALGCRHAARERGDGGVDLLIAR
ncbi:MAG: DUF2249 domain-containing protein [Ardenticatenaceae bacterium]|nr:DUF2249 domain-containing protein [Ardenticatenaceae bacterium]HBY96931.1 hypothetical protein [Chloroflexota bacterium]